MFNSSSVFSTLWWDGSHFQKQLILSFNQKQSLEGYFPDSVSTVNSWIWREESNCTAHDNEDYKNKETYSET